MRGRMRSDRARVSPAGHAHAMRTPAVLRHVSAADAYGTLILIKNCIIWADKALLYH